MVKNPRRVAAGRKNRAKRGEITAETRYKLSEAAKKNRPWKASTGPKTAKGKKVCSKNRAGTGKPEPAVSPLLTDAKALLGQMAAIRKSTVVNPETAEVSTGENAAELLQSILTSTHQSVLRKEVDALMSDVETHAGQD